MKSITAILLQFASTGLWHKLAIIFAAILYLIWGCINNKLFYPLAHSVPHSVDIHQALISGAADVRQVCSLMSKPVFIPGDFTQQTKNKHLMVASYRLLIFCPLKSSRRQYFGLRYCLSATTWIHCTKKCHLLQYHVKLYHGNCYAMVHFL